jgi:hypothetical protein
LRILGLQRLVVNWAGASGRPARKRAPNARREYAILNGAGGRTRLQACAVPVNVSGFAPCLLKGMRIRARGHLAPPWALRSPAAQTAIRSHRRAAPPD